MGIVYMQQWASFICNNGHRLYETMGIVDMQQWASFEKRMCRHFSSNVPTLFAKCADTLKNERVSTFYQKC